MLDIKYIRENVDIVKKAAQDKMFKVNIDKLLELDTSCRELTKKMDDLKEERNKLSSTIPTLNGNEKQEKISYVKELKDKISNLENEYSPLKEEFDSIMLTIPSVPAPEVPIGKGEEDNVELRRIGTVRDFGFEPKDHMDLAESLDLVDTPRGAKVAGSRSYYLKNEAALLQMALCKYVVDKLVSKGFTPMTVPVMVKPEAMYGTGYFPLGLEQAYAITEDNLYLVGTSEVALVSYHGGETLTSAELPKLYAGISECFRREAGTYGKDTRGLYRVHQFTKIEQVIFCEADDKKAEELHYFILNNVEELLQELELPYRICLACTGEIGIGQIRKHEVETWMPSRNAYCETHSCSTMGDFQARRSNIKYKDENGEVKYVYTLNNTAVASPRILIPLLENYQNEDGSVTIPKVLRPYMNGMEKIEKKNK